MIARIDYQAMNSISRIFQKGCSPSVRNIHLMKNLYTPKKNFVSSKLYAHKRMIGLGSCGIAFMAAGGWIHFTRVKCEQPSYTPEIKEDVHEMHLEWTWTDLYSLLRKEIPYLIISIMGAFTAAFMNVYIPLYLGDFVNIISQWFTERECIINVYGPAAKLCAAYFIQSCATFLYIGVMSSVGERIACRLRAQLFRKLIYQDVAYFDVHNAGTLIDKIGSDVQTFKSSFKLCVSQGLRNVTQVIGSLCALYSISFTLTSTLLSTLPCIILIGNLIGAQLRHLSRRAQKQASEAMSTAEESFSHIRSIKALALEDAQLNRFLRETAAANSLSEHLGYGIGLFQGLSNLALNGVILGVLYVGGHLLSRDQLTPGHLMSFLATTQTMQRSLAQLSMMYGQVVRGSTSLNRVLEVLHSTGTIDSAPDKQQSRTTALHDDLYRRWNQLGCAPELQFDQVRFAYPTRPETVVLNKLNMSIPAGKVVALVGSSGSGKSTVVSLIERFYDPLAGCISIGGYNLKDFSLSFLRGHLVGYISQEPQIFNTTVRENIRFGRPDASDAEVEQAAKLANAHDFISEQLSNGYETQVGQGTGSVAGLSGGQRQRIAIARVLLKNAPIIVLDEATSALDAESEAQVQSAINTIMKGRTVLIIAHRLSTIRRADAIMVMSRGNIVENGTHEELLRKRSAYFNLIERQQQGNDILS